MTYTHLTMEELCWIEHYFELGIPVKVIAKKLARALQTVYNVVNFIKEGRSIQEYYQNYRANKKRCGRKTKVLSDTDIEHIHEKQALGWTPDVIIHHEDNPLKLSVKTLYRRYRDDSRLDVKKLPMQGRRKPNGHMETRGRGSFCLTIHKRAEIFPDIANEFGHLEGDTIVGKDHQSRVITLAEKMYKSIITLKPSGTDATAVAERLDTWLSGLPKHTIKSITFDRGKEFALWKQLCNKHDIYIFFADVGSPSQRPLNEHSNGLLRRDGLPKQTDFNKLSEDEIQAVADFRNHIPRKSLGYKSPIEMLNTWVSGRYQVV